jgi:hypothetical protein
MVGVGPMRKSLLVASGLAIALMASAPASASILYSFTAFSSFGFGPDSNEQFSGNFDLITPDFVTAGATFLPSDLIDCAAVSNFGPATCTGEGFLTGFAGSDLTISFGVQGTTTGVGIFYYFVPAAFNTPGSYDTVEFGADQAGHLVVTDLGGTSPGVPEPAAWTMMIAGFGLAGSALRRTRRQTATA